MFEKETSNYSWKLGKEAKIKNSSPAEGKINNIHWKLIVRDAEPLLYVTDNKWTTGKNFFFCFSIKNKERSWALRKPAKQAAAQEPTELLLSLIMVGGMEALANVTATGSVCVCCVRTAPAAPRKICSDRDTAHPTTSTGLAKLREKSLEIPVFGWKVCDIFIFKDTQVPFFSPPRFIPQSRGKIAKISKKTHPKF